ncbi:MAG TPA: response regulator [Casimicrobiaceae bacterium]|nr:response regulator [Casimicrobiaceae bacterium]
MAIVRPNRVLLVDDDVDAVEALADFLGISGWVVHATYGGAQAVAVAPTFQPDVVVVDINMPGMDGFETAHRIRQLPSVKLVRIVGYSGAATAPIVRSTGSAYVECIVAKGAPLELLLAAMENQVTHPLFTASK